MVVVHLIGFSFEYTPPVQATMTLSGPDDVGLYGFNGAWKSICPNTGMLNMLPWESFFYAIGQIDGIPHTVTVLETSFVNSANVREACMCYLGDGPLTLKDRIKEVATNLKSLLTLERTFWD